MKASTLVARIPSNNPATEPIANSLNARPKAARSNELEVSEKRPMDWRIYCVPCSQRRYGKPQQNSDQNQVCELDHLVNLELGGADGLSNF